MIEKEELIAQYKADFANKTGEAIIVTISDKWQGKANFTYSISFWKIVAMVFDFNGWTKRATFTQSRKGENVFRRGLIDFIAMNNGCTFAECGRSTGRDHTTVMNSVKVFRDKLEKDSEVRKSFSETMEYIALNYDEFYKNKIIIEDDIQ